MATTTNKPVRPRPLPQRRGVDANTKQRLDRIAKENLGGDTEVTRGLYSIIQTFKVNPGKVFKDEKFPTLIFIVMVFIDLLDIIIGIFDITVVAWIIRVGVLIILPVIIVMVWAKGEGDKFKKEIDVAVDQMMKFTKKASTYAAKMGGKGAVKSGKKLAGKGIKHLLAERAKKRVVKKAMWRGVRLIFIGLVPILTFFGLWSYFIYAFHVSKMKEKENMDKSINQIYTMHANMANAASKMEEVSSGGQF